MNQPLVTLTMDADVADLRLNRPDKRNALTRELLQQSLEAVKKVASNATARMLILSSEGPVFCAGMDLQEMQHRAAQPNAKKEWADDAQIYRDLLVAIFQLPIPTLSVVQGPAVAGGVGLVAASDLVLASEAASFALPEPKRGITAAVVAPLVIYRIGPGAATAMLISGRTIPSDEALRIGICHFLVSSAKLEEKRRELCESILACSQGALTTTKRHLQRCTAETLLAQLDEGMKISAEARESDDAREGLSAFLEKRDPSWVRHPPGQNH